MCGYSLSPRLAVSEEMEHELSNLPFERIKTLRPNMRRCRPPSVGGINSLNEVLISSRVSAKRSGMFLVSVLRMISI